MTTESQTTPAPEQELPTNPTAEVAAAPTDVVAETPEAAPVATAAPAPAPAPEQPKGETKVADDADLFDAYMKGELDLTEGEETGFKKLSKGDRIEATIIQVDKDRVFVDLGTKAEGVVPMHELTDEPLQHANEKFAIGDKITVVVIKPEGGADSPAVVSRKRAAFEESWDRIEQLHKSQESIAAPVVDRVKGGLVVDIGVRGFVPATHVGNGKLRNIEKYVGQELTLKVIEIDRERKKVVLSNRQAEEERRAAAKEEIFQNVKPGAIMEGTVRRLTDYGAFVDLGGVDGLLHISEMSWMRISHPKEMFKEGQKIQVMILRLDPDTGKLSLGHRQVLPDPWNEVKTNYKVGQRLTVTVGRIVQGGAFIRLPEGAEAFIPVSEMSFRRIKRPNDVVEENQEVEVEVIDLRPDQRRMVLSMRAVGGGAAGRDPQPYEPGEYSSEEFRSPRTVGARPAGKKGGKKGRGRDFDDDFDDSGRRGFATGGATIGERLGMLKGLLSARETEETEETPEAAEPTDE
jgi:4-hydroxy-3-methylbut-2-enyl diphosphate reductase